MKIIKISQKEITVEMVKDPNCPPEILYEVLERGNDDWVYRHALRNPKCPPEALAKVIERGKNDQVSRYAASNPNCPPEVLAKVLERGKNDGVSLNASENPNCPPEALAKVLKRGNDDYVSRWAAKNQNCPPEAKIAWMMATGKIEKENPNDPHHVIEYEGKEEKKDNLDELRKLVSSNKVFNLSKMAQKEITLDMVNDPNCPPEILAEVLARGKNDYVSRYAALNPNCPPEALTKVLARGNDDYVSQSAASNPKCPPEALAKVLERGMEDEVSWSAANNPNCPPEALAKVLERGKNNGVSRYAAENPNCPSEALAKVLARGKNDYVSRWASENPNCPPEAKIAWMMATGQIEKENPNDPHHVIEYEGKEEKKDNLDELRKLISNNKVFNLSKVAQKEITIEMVKDPCPSEVLAKVLEIGNDDRISWYAAKNPNCPPEVLAKVLERGNNDGISWFASRSPNCPTEAKIAWMMATGKIEKENPNDPHHVIEYEGKEDKKDNLDELRKLVSSNKVSNQ